MIADALDSSDVVVVCWSKASIASEVLAEASEGLRRGALLRFYSTMYRLAFAQSTVCRPSPRHRPRASKLVDAVTQVARELARH
jgi:hypothetical protein